MQVRQPSAYQQRRYKIGVSKVYELQTGSLLFVRQASSQPARERVCSKDGKMAGRVPVRPIHMVRP